MVCVNSVVVVFALRCRVVPGGCCTIGTMWSTYWSPSFTSVRLTNVQLFSSFLEQLPLDLKTHCLYPYLNLNQYQCQSTSLSWFCPVSPLSSFFFPSCPLLLYCLSASLQCPLSNVLCPLPLLSSFMGVDSGVDTCRIDFILFPAFRFRAVTLQKRWKTVGGDGT